MALWTADFMRGWLDAVDVSSLITRSVGLKVTSLKWTGPEPDPDASPEIPQEIEYRDAVPRAADIGLPNDDMSRNSSRSENGMTPRLRPLIDR